MSKHAYELLPRVPTLPLRKQLTLPVNARTLHRAGLVTLAQMKARQQLIDEAREATIKKKLSSFGEPEEVTRKKKKKKQAKVGRQFVTGGLVVGGDWLVVGVR